jgi:hypothetical protein
MYAGYFTVKASVGGRLVGVAAEVLDEAVADGDAAGEELGAAALLGDVDGVLLVVGCPAVSTVPSSPPVSRSAT